VLASENLNRAKQKVKHYYDKKSTLEHLNVAIILFVKKTCKRGILADQYIGSLKGSEDFR